MTKRIVILTAASLALVAGFIGCQGGQSKPPCLVGHGGFAMKYTPKAGQTLTGACADKKGEVVGFAPFYNDGGTRQDGVGMKTATLTALEDTPNVGLDPDHEIISMGTLTAIEPDKDDFCYAPTLSKAEQHIPKGAVDPGDPDAGIDPTPAADVNIVYNWSNVKFYVTPRAPGTQMAGELEYEEDGCTGKYDVVGVYPAVHCAVLDEDYNPVLTDAGTVAIDPTLCEKYNDFGRTLSPEFPITCDPDTQLCVLSKAPPAFK